jgi:hypothetical protein
MGLLKPPPQNGIKQPGPGSQQNLQTRRDIRSWGPYWLYPFPGDIQVFWASNFCWHIVGTGLPGILLWGCLLSDVTACQLLGFSFWK